MCIIFSMQQERPFARTINLGVQWETDPRFESMEMIYGGLRYILSDEYDRPGIRIVDSSAWVDADEARIKLPISQLPVLVLAPENEQGIWLEAAGLGHDVCPKDSPPELIALRSVRTYRRSRNYQRLIKRSLVDPLTGLLNRSEFHRKLEVELEVAVPDRPLALLIADLDNFKDINDEYGHTAGDRVLTVFANFLKASVGDASSVYRYGGDEFTILLKTHHTQARALGEFIRREMAENPIVISDDKTEVELTVSIGIAIAEGIKDVPEFVQRADKALYQAKVQGRNSVVDYQTFSEEARDDGSDPDIRDFENQIRVLTERLTRTLTYRSQKLFSNVREQADVDALTSLYNRGYFDKRMEREFESAVERTKALSLIFIDIDHFGQVNKTYGFTVGDQALREVTGHIVDSVRPTDWVARYGGEEICVILPDTLEDQAVEIAERIRVRVESSTIKDFDGRDFSVTVSAGVAQLSGKDDSLKAFIQRTGNRTRRAKEAGRNRTCREDGLLAAEQN